MKKKILLVLTTMFACVTLHAQFAQMSLLTPHYYPGEVYFKDGHSEEFAEVELPRVGKSELGVKKNAGDKGHKSIDAESIIGIKIWHKDFPDKPHILYYIHARKALMNSDHQWGYPYAESAWGIVFQCEQNYQMNKKNGDLDYVKFVGGSAPDTPTLFYLMRPEWNQAELLLVNNSWAIKKKVATYFAENAEIATAIKKGKLKANDLQYILDEMAGGQKMEMPIKAIPVVKSESTSNGVVGDDE